MSKKIENIEKTIQKLESKLESLKGQKEKQDRDARLIDSQFENLPKTIENIVAHICISVKEKIFVVFPFEGDSFYVDNNLDMYKFNGLGRCFVNSDGGPYPHPYAYLPVDEVDFLCNPINFGCVVVPVEKNMYRIEPFKIDPENGEIILDGDE